MKLNTCNYKSGENTAKLFIKKENNAFDIYSKISSTLKDGTIKKFTFQEIEVFYNEQFDEHFFIFSFKDLIAGAFSDTSEQFAKSNLENFIRNLKERYN